jgi:hypothetical protein
MEMRADMAAAFLDLPTTTALYRAVARGEAPRPTGMRGIGKDPEPVWSRPLLEAHIAQRHGMANDATGTENIAGLI